MNPDKKTSKFKGVYFHKATKYWAAEITARGVRHRLGTFRSEVEAAEAYRVAAIKYHREFAYASSIPD